MICPGGPSGRMYAITKTFVSRTTRSTGYFVLRGRDFGRRLRAQRCASSTEFIIERKGRRAWEGVAWFRPSIPIRRRIQTDGISRASAHMDKPSRPRKPSADGDVSSLLRAWSDGDQSAIHALTPIVYDELHRLARHYMRRERPGHSLQATA